MKLTYSASINKNDILYKMDASFKSMACNQLSDNLLHKEKTIFLNSSGNNVINSFLKQKLMLASKIRKKKLHSFKIIS